ncbi:glutamate receptor-interacting protein 2 isoform X2 [Ischnura elegans]|uniref:glutamate receptor-interacting protein 2 isoform X2 n=1 Tax=Ischnura elegans TaxID=197161 RepID=UPI001ED8AB34|nr:glutamate receptor-interacting protein 2 isoform X2 [Ischnura elegans]
MFAALGLHSSPMAKGDQLCHARVLCPQKSSSMEEDAPEEEEVNEGCGCRGNTEEDPGIQISKRLIQVAVKRDTDGSLGITLCGGACTDNSTFSRPLIISHVRPNGPVHRVGSIRAGDRLLAVDGHSTEHVTLAEAQTLLSRHNHCVCWERDDLECSGETTPCCLEECCTLLVIEYDVVVRQGLSKTRGPFLVELQMDHPGEELGLSLAMLPEERVGTELMQPRPAALVEAVRPASIAERCGALHPGDVLLSIGEVCYRGGRAGRDASLLPSSSWVLHMEVLPLSQMDQRTHGSSHCGSDFGGSRNGAGRRCPASRGEEEGGECRPGEVGSTGSSSNSSSLVWAVESARGGGWGHRRRPRVSPAHPRSENGSQRGGEILQLEEFLQTANDRASEQCESIGPPWQQGSFQSLGGAPIRASNERLMVERGGGESGPKWRVSPTMEPICWIGESQDSPPLMAEGGDDDDGDCMPSKDSAVNDAASAFPLLPFVGDEEMEVYMVQVPTDGGPLGITLSGTEDPLEYVTISGLVEGGPAQRTATLGIGDRLLAVGGESLIGRPLSEAVTLLRAASDPVILHVARPLSLRCDPPTALSAMARDNLPTSPVVDAGQRTPLLDLLSVGDEASPASHGGGGGSEFDEGLPNECHAEPSVEICTFRSTNGHQSPPLVGNHLNQNSSSQISLGNVMNHPVSYDSDQQSSLNHSSLSRSIGESARGGSNIPQPSRTETLRLTLYKDDIYEDFGFSVSDGLYERGVYVNRIRKGGPADIGALLPYDRIIQVNDTMTYAFDCCLTVPLIASAGDKIDLTIVRSL